MIIRLLLAGALTAFAAGAVCSAQLKDTIRVCTYNVLNYGDAVDPTRVLSFQDVLGAVRPHILVLQEIRGQEGIDGFATNAAATSGTLVPGPFTDGPDADNGILFDSSRIAVIDHAVIATPLRNVDRWRLVVRATGDTVDVWGLHLKAGDADSNVTLRDVEASIVRRSLDSSDRLHRIVAGDLNTYSGSEPAFIQLTYTGIREAGEVTDPIGRGGPWHANDDYADVHTQSTRGRAFEGGVGGGMDDRFDFVLLSPSLMTLYREGSYTTFGNDGNHFNDSINAMPNTAVVEELAMSLHRASDHLPVYLELVFGASPSGVREFDRRRHMDLTDDGGGR